MRKLALFLLISLVVTACGVGGSAPPVTTIPSVGRGSTMREPKDPDVRVDFPSAVAKYGRDAVDLWARGDLPYFNPGLSKKIGQHIRDHDKEPLHA